MDINVFHKVVKSTKQLTLGGGEPTIHPKFREFLDLTFEYTSWPQIITNGSMTEIAIELAALAKKGKIVCVLSLDEYHDPIDPTVIKAFEGAHVLQGNRLDVGGQDTRGIVTAGTRLSNHGRCDWGYNHCPCESPFIKPSGLVHVCGCDDSPVIGDIQSGSVIPNRTGCHSHEIHVLKG